MEESKLIRRNLLAISVFLVFYYYSGAEINGAGFLGIKASMDNKEALVHIVWWVWLYFLCRHIQFFYSEGLNNFKLGLNSYVKANYSHRLLGISKEELHTLPDDDYIRSSTIKFGVNYWVSPPKRLHRTPGISTSSVNLIAHSYMVEPSILKRLKKTQLIGVNVTIYPVASRHVSSYQQRAIRTLNWKESFVVLIIISKYLMLNPEFLGYFGPIVISLSPIVFYALKP